MDANSKKKVPQNTITRDIKNLAAPTGNIYESVVVLYKRANQIAAAEKKELMRKLEDFRPRHDGRGVREQGADRNLQVL